METEKFHGITLDSGDYIPKEIAAVLIDQMKSTGGYVKDSELKETLQMTSATYISLIRTQRAYRLTKKHIELFLEKHPNIAPEKLFNGSIAKPPLGNVPPQKKSPPSQPDGDTFVIPKDRRVKFIAGLCDLTGLRKAGDLFEIFPKDEQEIFIENGIITDQWMNKIKNFPNWKTFLERHPTVKASLAHIREDLRPDPENDRDDLLNPGTKKRQLEATLEFNEKIPEVVAKAIFKASFAAGRSSHLSLETQTFLGSLVADLSDWTIQYFPKENYVLLSKKDQVFRVSTGDLLK